MVAWNLTGPQGKGSVPSSRRFRVKKQGWRNRLRTYFCATPPPPSGPPWTPPLPEFRFLLAFSELCDG